MTQQNPITQKFRIGLSTSIPASVLHKDDVIGFLNSPGSSFWDGTLDGAYTVANLIGVGLPVLSTNVSNASWRDVNGNCELDFVLTTTSDPINSGQVSNSTLAMIGIIVVVLGAALVAIPGGGEAADIIGIVLAAAGALTIALSFVTEIVGTGGGVALIVLGGIAAVGAVIYLITRK
jgi:hypothetical protein